MTNTDRRPLARLDPATFADPTMRRTVQWHLLLTEADRLTERTGYGLAAVWAAVRSGDYHGARHRLDTVSRCLAEEPSAAEGAP